MLVLVLGWTQCLPQGVGAPPDMLRGRTAGFPKKLGGAGPLERRGRWIQFTQCSPLTVAHQPRAGCIRLVHGCACVIMFPIICILTKGIAWF